MNNRKNKSGRGPVTKRVHGGAEQKLGQIGANTGEIVDKVLSMPGEVVHSVAKTASSVVGKTSSATEKVANWLNPDSGKKN